MKFGFDFRSIHNHVLNVCIEEASGMLSTVLVSFFPKAETEARKHDQIVGVRDQSISTVMSISAA